MAVQVDPVGRVDIKPQSASLTSSMFAPWIRVVNALLVPVQVEGQAEPGLTLVTLVPLVPLVESHMSLQ